jgi:hypothetical protein
MISSQKRNLLWAILRRVSPAILRSGFSLPALGGSQFPNLRLLQIYSRQRSYF